VDNKEARETFGKRHLEKCMACSRWMTPRVLPHGQPAEKSSRVEPLRSEEREISQLCNALDYFRMRGFLQRNHVGACSLDHLGDLFSSADSALTDVVAEEAQVYASFEVSPSSTFGFESRTRYG